MKYTLLFVAPLFACTADKSDTADTPLSDTEFQGGNFQFTNSSVDDQCLDGAFSVLFLPDGTDHNWEYPVELPSDSATPATYDIQLQDPFSVMEVTVESGSSSGSFIIANAVQQGVLFNEDSYPDCTVDLSIDATITATDSNNITGQGTLSVIEYTGDTCPPFASSPCSILLDFYGSRL